MTERCVICGDFIDVLDNHAFVTLNQDFIDWKTGDEVGPLCIDCLLDMTTQKIGTTLEAK
jgi:hypothetical protein